jgi:hypothetical protein
MVLVKKHEAWANPTELMTSTNPKICSQLKSPFKPRNQCIFFISIEKPLDIIFKGEHQEK